MTEHNCENCPKPDCDTYHPERCAWLHSDGPEKATTERKAYAATGITISAKEDPNGYAKAYYQLKKAALRAYTQQWKAAHPGQHGIYKARWRAKKKAESSE